MKLKKQLISTMLVIFMFFTCSINAFATNTSAEAQIELNKLQEESKNKLDEINQLEAELVNIGEKIIENKKNLEKAEKSYEEKYENAKEAIKFMYENNTSIMKLEKIVESKSLVSLNSNLDYISKVEEYNNEKIEDLKAAYDNVQKIQTNLEEEENELKKKQEELNKEEEELEKEIEDKKIEIQDLIKKEAEENKQSVDVTVGQNASAVEKILAAAYSQLGVPYVWGGTTPNVGLDCSGLTQYCHRQAGISIPRLAEMQSLGPRVSNPQPGDIVAYSYHVGIYIGNGMMIAAPKPGDHVKIQPVYGHPWYVRWW